MNEAEHQKTILRHCLDIAATQPGYALWAAQDYEDKSFGVLDGLHARVQQAIKKHRESRQPSTPGENHAL